jgi:sulfur carrier protein
MERTVTVSVVGGEKREVSVGPDATYGDLLAAVELSPHEATALVDERPVPEDARVEAEEVRVLRLVRGG